VKLEALAVGITAGSRKYQAEKACDKRHLYHIIAVVVAVVVIVIIIIIITRQTDMLWSVINSLSSTTIGLLLL